MATTDSSPRTAPRRLGRRLVPLVEALLTPHPIDTYVELVRPAWSIRDIKAELIAVRHPTPNSVTLTLRPNANWEGFRAGQFVRLSVEIDGRRQARCYSPSRSEHAGRELELTVREHPEGEVSRYLNREARPGLVVGLSEAEGDFTLPATRPERLLLISGGSGITPVISMLRTLCDEGHRGAVTFLHYARSEAELIYRDELAELAARHPNVDLVRAYTRAPEAGELRGHFSREHLRAAVPDYAEAEAYVSGPPALIDAVRSTWEEDDLVSRLHVEHFVPPAPSVVLGEAEGVLRFTDSGIEAPNSGASLLEQAEAAGLQPEHGCRMGICHTCTSRKRCGSVRNASTGEVSTTPDEDIQLCITTALGDVELEL